MFDWLGFFRDSSNNLCIMKRNKVEALVAPEALWYVGIENMTNPEVEELSGKDLTEELAIKKNKKGSRIINPVTGGLIYGIIPQNKSIEEGPIYLKLGYQGSEHDKKGAKGARHIYDKHHKDLSLKSFSDVPKRLTEILLEGSSIMVNPITRKNPLTNPLVLRTGHGVVGLHKFNEGGTTAYEIITAFGAPNAQGFEVAKLKKPK